MKVRVFAGDKNQIWTVYYKLLIDNKISAIIEGNGNFAEIKVEPKDYINALSVGANAINKASLDAIVWIGPDGKPAVRFGETYEKTSKSHKTRQIVAFSGISAIEANVVADYLKNVADIEALTSVNKHGKWEVYVPTVDYFQAVNIGAKVIDGRKFTGTRWNSPVGEEMFDVSTLAQIARTENDEILEA